MKAICPSPNCNEDVSAKVKEECARPDVPVATLASPGRAGAKPAPACRVHVQCSQGHWAEYSCEDGTSRLLSQADVDQLTQLQSWFKPTESLKRVDEFAKWLFATIAVVGTLGTGLSTVASGGFPLTGKLCLGSAVFLLGLSLFFATLAIEPRFDHTKPGSTESMLDVLQRNLKKRRFPVRWAGGLFAAALVVAAMAPIVSALSMSIARPAVALSYVWKPNKTLSTQMKAVGMLAYSPVELIVLSGEKGAAREEARVRKSIGPDGSVDVLLDILVSSAEGSRLQVVGKWADTTGSKAELLHEERVMAVVPVATVVASIEDKMKTPAITPTPANEKSRARR